MESSSEAQADGRASLHQWGHGTRGDMGMSLRFWLKARHSWGRLGRCLNSGEEQHPSLSTPPTPAWLVTGGPGRRASDQSPPNLLARKSICVECQCEEGEATAPQGGPKLGPSCPNSPAGPLVKDTRRVWEPHAHVLVPCYGTAPLFGRLPQLLSHVPALLEKHSGPAQVVTLQVTAGN